MPPLLPHIPDDTDARAYLAPAELDDDAIALLRQGDTVEAFLSRLMDRGMWIDAIRVVARALHPQHAVAWALDTVSAAPPREGAGQADTDGALLEIVQRWLDEPGDTAPRRKALVAAEDAGYNGPAAWVAAAVGWSGGSIAPAELPPVEPPEGLCARSAAAAIVIASIADPDRIDRNTEAALRVGLDYAAQDPPKAGAPAQRREQPEPKADDPDDQTDKPRLRSLRRSHGETTAPDQRTKSPDPAPPAPARSLRRKSSGSPGWGSGSDDDSGAGWNPKPL
ncbi:MAG: DUF6931 family protein [Phycisphaerales bacterium JB040]